jgi:tRNA pseudouridine55 synthase
MTQAVHVRAVAFDGVLNLKKEAGWTSHDVVAKVRGCLGGRVGHAGTLDPAAVGVLPVLVGKATRIAEYLLEWDKTYVAVLRLGETTDTQDATGRLISQRDTEHLTEAAIRTAIAQFRGKLRQVPPMYSAVKVGGVPLYKSARAGRTVRREARDVIVHDLDVLAMADRDVTVRVTCSKGTYIRTLCADIGEALGVGGHLHRLERTRVGPLSIDTAIPLSELCERLERQEAEAVMPFVLSMDQALAQLADVTVTEAAAVRVRHGVAVGPSAILCPENLQGRLVPCGAVRLKDRGGRLIGLGVVPSGALDATGGLTGSIKVTKVLSNA